MLHAALLVLHLHPAVQQRINVSQSAYSEPHYIQFSFLCLFQLLLCGVHLPLSAVCM